MQVGVVMGSKSDLPTMGWVGIILGQLGIPFEERILSAHRTPVAVQEYALGARGRLGAIIAGAGGAAHLPGMLASYTIVPVVAVPCPKEGTTLDAVLSMIEMPAGVPVGVCGHGRDAAANAAYFVARWLARHDLALEDRLFAVQRRMVAETVSDDDDLHTKKG